ncbi:MAG: hypothetical protein WC606_03075 [Candidatus Absconditabacterales bacterium]
MKRTLAAIAITSIALTSSVLAADCNLVVGENIDAIAKNYDMNYKKYETVIPLPSFKQALINLKAYCCSQVIQKSCTQEEKDTAKQLKYPESAYFFDHLLDIAMRRLDGIQNLAYGLDLDPTGLARRAYITEAANNPMGTQAMQLEAKYKEYRKLNTKRNIDIVIANYDKNNLATLSLGDKYNTLCEIIKNMYEEVQTDNRTIIGGYGDKNSFFNGCENLINDRVKRENGYVKILMIQKSNKLLDETTKAYTKKHFVEEKLMALWTLVAKVKDMFQTIVQQAPASKSCSK